jgi:hypothetical protein
MELLHHVLLGQSLNTNRAFQKPLHDRKITLMGLVMAFGILSMLTTLCLSASAQAQHSPYEVAYGSVRYAPSENIAQFDERKRNLKSALFAGQTANAEQQFYVVVQFHAIPGMDATARLKAAGVELLEYVQGNAYFAAVPERLTGSDLQAMNVRALDPIRGEGKLSAPLAAGNVPEQSRVKQGFADLVVSTYEALSRERVVAALQAFGAEILSERTGFSSFVVRVPLDRIRALADEPYILFINALSPTPTTDNRPGQMSHRVNTLRSNNASIFGGRNLTGEGVRVGMWDGGGVGNHIDLNSRTTQVERGPYSDHGTHVLGTIGGGGHRNPTAEGMAPRARLFTWDFGGDVVSEELSSLTTATINLAISSHSYNSGLTPPFGIYNPESRDMDNIVRRFPYYMHVHSAGNAGPAPFTITSTNFNTKGAKNIITVANMDNINTINPSSSRGPMQDGRLYPHVAGVGTSVLSTQDNNSYAIFSGTSMSTPGVSGTIALLYQRFYQLNNNAQPRAALMKALVCNTADDAGNPGPDYTFGYGRINALRAVEALERRWFTIDSIGNGDTRTTTITVPAGVQELKVMVCWTDREGTPFSPSLVNNLNMQVSGPSGTFNPWIVDAFAADPLSPFNRAVRGVDNINNVEQVTIPTPTPGTYTVTVTGAAVPFGPQEYALSYDLVPSGGLRMTFPTGLETFVSGRQEFIRWEAAGVTQPFRVEFSTDNGTTWRTISTAVSPTDRVLAWVPPADVVAERVTVRVSSGEFSTTNTVSFAVLRTPENLVSESGDRRAQMFWTPVLGAAQYEIVRFNPQNETWQAVASTTGSSFVLTNLENNVRTWYSVRSVSANGIRSERAVAVSAAPSVPYTVTGQVIGDGLPFGGVEITVSGDNSFRVVTDAAGRFTLNNLTGENTVRAARAGYIFLPETRTFPFGTTGAQTLTFTATKALQVGVQGGNGNNAATSIFTPYSGVNRSVKTHLLVRASELAAIGAQRGNVSALGFLVVAVNESNPLLNFSIRIANTPIATLATVTATTRFAQANFTNVFATNAHIPIEGLNLHTFQRPFMWDGTSNVLIETCFDGSIAKATPTMQRTVVPFTSVHIHVTDATGVCDSVSVLTSSTIRPNMVFSFEPVGGVPPPLPPRTIFPAEAASQLSTTTTFTWQRIPDVDAYRVEISPTAAFTQIIQSITVFAPSATSSEVSAEFPTGQSLLHGTRYFWRVRAVRGFGASAINGEWSAVASFTTIPVTDVPQIPLFMGAGTGEIRRTLLPLMGSIAPPPILRGYTSVLGMAVDTLGKRLFFVRGGAAGTDEQFITRSDLNGANQFDVVADRGTLIDVALDVNAGQMYWTNSAGGTIHRADMFGRNSTVLVSAQTNPWGLALDLSGDKMYWTELNGFRVRRANLDGSGIETLFTGTTALRGLKINPATGHIYFAETATGTIWRMNLDGSNRVAFIREPGTGAAQGQPRDIELDVENNWIYWTNQNLGTVVRARLSDGSERMVITTVATVVGLGLGTGAFGAPFNVTAFVPTQTVVQGLANRVVGVEVVGGSGNVRLTARLDGGSNGVLNVNTTIAGGVTAEQVTGNGTSSVTITAPRLALNRTLAAPNGLAYRPANTGQQRIVVSGADGSGASSPERTITMNVISASTPLRLDYRALPQAELTAGTALNAVQVAVVDVAGNVVTGDTREISLTATLVGGTPPFTTSVRANAVAGVATLSGITLNRAGTYAVFATTASLPNLPALQVNVNPADVTTIAFTGAPAATVPINSVTAATVQLRDNFGNRVINTPGTVTLTFSSTGGTVTSTGTLRAPTLFGIASFPNLVFTVQGTYSLTASLAIGTTGSLSLAPRTFVVVAPQTATRATVAAFAANANNPADNQPANILTSVNATPDNPSKLGLVIYPNPSAGESVTVEYTLAEALPRINAGLPPMLDVYDALGGKVASVVLPSLAAGKHRLMLDIRSLPTGAYLCRISTVFGTQSVMLNVTR